MLGKKRKNTKKNLSSNYGDGIIQKTSEEMEELINLSCDEDKITMAFKIKSLSNELAELNINRKRLYEVLILDFIHYVNKEGILSTTNFVKKISLFKNSAYIEINRLERGFVVLYHNNIPLFVETMSLFTELVLDIKNNYDMESCFVMERNGDMRELKKCIQGKIISFNIKDEVKIDDNRRVAWEMMFLFYNLIFGVNNTYTYVPSIIRYDPFKNDMTDICSDAKFLLSLNDEDFIERYNEINLIVPGEDINEKVKMNVLRGYLLMLGK